MNKVLSILAAAVLAGGWLLPAATAAESAGRMRVEDKAGAFTPDGIKKAEEAFANTSFQSPTHFTVVTVGENDVPAGKKADFEAAQKNPGKLAGPFFRDWARELARAERERGVFTLVYLQGDKYFVDVVADRESDVHRNFTDQDARDVRDALIDGFRKTKETGDKAARDAALLAATNVVINQLKDTSAPEAGTASRTHSSDADTKRGGGTNIMGYVCIGLAVLLGVWLVVGLIRAFTGGGGGGYGGGGYGGGGGGFFPSLMGGLFGAAAGMYLYDSFMGGHSSAAASDAAAGDAGDMGGAEDSGAGDFDAGAEAGGGDFGDAGGDFGGGDLGGGDVGGGGDFGGGDW